MSILRRAWASRLFNVGAAIAVSSLIGYLLLAAVGRNLSKGDFGLFMSFWGLLFGLASSLSMIEQEAARQSARGEQSQTAPILRVMIAAAVFAGTIAAFTMIPAISELVYGRADASMGLLVFIATLGFAAQFMIRGLLIGSGQVRDYGFLVVAESAIRLMLLGLACLTVGLTLGVSAAAVAAGAFAWLGYVRPARRVLHGMPNVLGADLHSWLDPLRRAGSLMFAAALTAAMITGYTTMITVFSAGSSPSVRGSVFAALTVSRVPLLFVAPLQALAVPTIIRWQHSATTTSNDMRRLLIRGGLGTLGVALIGAVCAWFIGPWAVQLALGSKYVVTPATIAGLVFSACFLGLLQLMSAALIAFGKYKWMTIVWALATGTTVLWLVFSPLGLVGSTVVGALIGPAVGATLAMVLLWQLAATQIDTAPAVLAP